MRLPVVIILIAALAGAAGAETVYTVIPDINGDKPGNCIVEITDDPAAGEEIFVNITSAAPETTILIRNKWYRVFRGQTPVEGLVLKTDTYGIQAKASNFKTTEFDITLESGKRYDLSVELNKHSISRGVHLAIVLGAAGAITLTLLLGIALSLKGAN